MDREKIKKIAQMMYDSIDGIQEEYTFGEVREAISFLLRMKAHDFDLVSTFGISPGNEGENDS